MISTRWLRPGMYMTVSCSASAQMHGEELGDGGIDATPVIRANETVAGVIEREIGHRLLPLAQRGDDLFAFADRHAWIARPVGDQHRSPHAVHAMDRRDACEQFAVALWIAIFRGAMLAAPCTGAGQQRD